MGVRARCGRQVGWARKENSEGKGRRVAVKRGEMKGSLLRVESDMSKH